MDDFLITTLYEYNRCMAEDYLSHSWGKKPEQKKAEKKYNHEYYEKYKNKWKTKYYHYEKKLRDGAAKIFDSKNQPSAKASVGASKKSVDGSDQPKKYSGVAYDYVSTTKSTPHLDTEVVDKRKKMTRALRIGAEAVIGVGGLIAGAALTTVLPYGGISLMAASAGLTYSAGSEITKAIVGEIKNKKYQKQREKEPIDPKTGFHVKQENLSPEEDIKRVNPQNKDLDDGTKNNCMLCSVTYDLRQRGYDVQANRADTGYNIQDLTRWYKNPEVEAVPNSPTGKLEDIDSSLIAKNFEILAKNQGEGASGVIIVEWAQSGSGHAMHYEYKNGKVRISDPQTGKIYDNPADILQYTQGASIVRLDNKEVNWKAVKECCA